MVPTQYIYSFHTYIDLLLIDSSLRNELGCLTKEIFLDLICGAVASASLSVLDLQDNFPRGGFGASEMGPPPPEVVEDPLERSSALMYYLG